MSDLQRALVVASVVLLALLIHLLKPILTPFLVAALLAYLTDPIADRLENWKMNRTLAVCVVFATLTLVFAIVLLVTIPLVGQQLDLLVRKLPEWLHTFQRLVLPWLQKTFDLPADSLPIAQFKSALSEHWMSAGSMLTAVWRNVTGSGVALAAWLANLVLIPVVMFYLLRDWDVLVAKIHDLLPRRIEPRAVMLARESDEIVGAFIRGQLLVMLALGIIYSIGLSIVGLEMALLLGMLAGLASIVPYMGFIVGIIAASIAAYFQFQEWLPLLWVAIVFGIGQMLEGMVLTPMLVGDRIGLHPVAVIFAVMAGGQLAGFAGVLLALPVAAVVMVLLRHIHDSYMDSELYNTADDTP